MPETRADVVVFAIVFHDNVTVHHCTVSCDFFASVVVGHRSSFTLSRFLVRHVFDLQCGDNGVHERDPGRPSLRLQPNPGRPAAGGGH